MNIDFAQSAQSSVGVEWELALVDAQTGELVSVAEQVLDAVRAGHPELKDDDEHPHVKQELLLNTVELVTGVCRTVGEAKADLSSAMRAVREVTDPMGVELFCAGSHPFAAPRSQPVTDKARYAKLIDRTQWWGRQMVIYGVHVHVGLDRPGQGAAGAGRAAQLLPAFPGALAASARTGAARTPATPRSAR